MIIYKITNQVNNKVYIGLTTETLQKRWIGHKQASKTCERHLYKSMRKYGLDNFTIEEIDSTDNFQILGQLERKYIKEYNSQNPQFGYNITAGGESNQLDANPRAKLSVEEIIQIREIYAMCELRCKDCWKLYQDRISFSAFQKIWEGVTWTSILPEVYTETNMAIHSQQTANNGSSNGNAIYSDEEVLEIRKYYVNHTLEETFKKYGSKSKSKTGFRGTVERSYKYLPIYSKTKKSWFLQGNPIDIDNYNPVSTIPVSREQNNY